MPQLHLRKGTPLSRGRQLWRGSTAVKTCGRRQHLCCHPGDNALLSPPTDYSTPDLQPFLDSPPPPSTTGPAAYSNVLSASTQQPLTAPAGPFSALQQIQDVSTAASAAHALLPACHVQRLHMKDYALVEEATVDFKPGLNVITGESGAGKSVLMGGLDLILGGVASAECVRPPAEVALLEGTFFLSAASYDTVRECLVKLNLPDKALPAEVEDGWQLILKREVTSSKEAGTRSRCFVNGCSTSLRVLREVGAALVDANGQHSALRLRDKSEQLQLLDRLAGTSSLLAQLSDAMAIMNDLETQLQQLQELSDEGERDRLQQLCEMVQRANIYPGEVAALRSQLRVLETRRAATEQCGVVAAQMAGDGGVLGAMSNLERQLRAVLHQEQAQKELADDIEDGSEQHSEAGEEEEDDDGDANMGIQLMEEALRKLVEAKGALAAAKSSVEDYVDAFEYNEADHQALSERLKRVERLIRHWDCRDDHELLQMATEAEAKLEKYYDLEDKQEDWEEGLKGARERVLDLTLQLSQHRRGVAGRLRESVGNCLKDLSMSDSRFDVQIRWQELDQQTSPSTRCIHVPQEAAEKLWEQGGVAYRLFPTGLDQVEFLLAAAPAEPLRPLSAVASGGESARVMMALKAAPAHVLAQGLEDCVDEDASPAPRTVGGAPVLVLDELDSGVGSRLGFSVGRMLRSMTQPPALASSQILCVTHLPQVACHAQHHIKVLKEQTEEGRARTKFVPLDDEKQRATEVSAMLGLGLEAAVALMQKSGSIDLEQAARILGLLNSPSSYTASPATGAHAAATPGGNGTMPEGLNKNETLQAKTHGVGAGAGASNLDIEESRASAPMNGNGYCAGLNTSEGNGAASRWVGASGGSVLPTSESGPGSYANGQYSEASGAGSYGVVGNGTGAALIDRSESGVVDRLMHKMLIDVLSVGWQMVEDMVPNNGSSSVVKGSKHGAQ